MAGMPSFAAISASRTASSMFTRSTPGMCSTGRRRSGRSTRKIGQIRSAGLRVFSATSRRDQGGLAVAAHAHGREGADRAIGLRILGGALVGRGAALGERLAERLHGAPLPCGCWARIAHCGQARGQGKGLNFRAMLLADLGVLDALGHVDVEMVLVGVVGLGAQHRIEERAGGAVGSAQEIPSCRWEVLRLAAAWDRPGGSAGRARGWGE